MSDTYPLAPNAVFATVQGEGILLGTPMVFVRLAGCSVGCTSCDTDYSVARRATAEAVADEVSWHFYGPTRWVWVTGGEPTDHDLPPLYAALRRQLPTCRIALATAGVRATTPHGRLRGGPDFVSVSPHDPARWAQRSGDQLNLVPGLNGRRLADFLEVVDACAGRFAHRYVTPCAGRPETLDECLKWLRACPGWRLGIQAHVHWGLP